MNSASSPRSGYPLKTIFRFAAAFSILAAAAGGARGDGPGQPAARPAPAPVGALTLSDSPTARWFRAFAAAGDGERRDLVGRRLPARAADADDRELSDSFSRHDPVRAAAD